MKRSLSTCQVVLAGLAAVALGGGSLAYVAFRRRTEPPPPAAEPPRA